MRALFRPVLARWVGRHAPRTEAGTGGRGDSSTQTSRRSFKGHVWNTGSVTSVKSGC